MPLINLTTDLKTLQYGNDRPGGGSSGLPYVVSPNPDLLAPVPPTAQQSNFLDFYASNRNTLDFPIRGGSIQLDGETLTTTTAAGRIDRARIQAFLNDKQRGTTFLLKQTGLQLTNPKTQVPGLFERAGETVGLIESTRFYNPTGITTLLQTFAQGTGVHIPRHGAIPDTTGLFTTGYEFVVTRNNDELGNRLLLLRGSKLLSDTPITQTYVGKAFEYGISLLNNEVLNYAGGPGSTYGIGNTTIKRATNTNTSKVYRSIAFSYDTIANQKSSQGQFRAHPTLQDFREQINTQAGYRAQVEGNYKDNWIQTRLQTGNPGGTLADDGFDRLNAQGLFYYNTFFEPWNIEVDGSKSPKDLIKFVFECVSNDVEYEAVAIIFRSFLTGITDNHQADFNSFKYLGRGETFRTYQGFDRSVSFSFKIAAFSAKEMKALYTKLNHLVSQIYPDYSPTTRFMRGNIIKLTIGDYLYRVPGFLESVNITIDDNVAWEVALNQPSMRELPQVVSVQCNFKPIHDILPRRESVLNPYVPLIANTRKQYLIGEIAEGETRLAGQPQPATPIPPSLEPINPNDIGAPSLSPQQSIDMPPIKNPEPENNDQQNNQGDNADFQFSVRTGEL
jgi:hypothetical protein